VLRLGEALRRTVVGVYNRLGSCFIISEVVEVFLGCVIAAMYKILGEFFGWARFGCKVVFGLSAVIVGMLYLYQDKILYIPKPPNFPPNPPANPVGFRSPGEWNVEGKQYHPSDGVEAIPFEETMLTTSDNEKLHVWLLLQPEGTSNRVPTLIYFHGNAGNMGFRLQNAALMYAICGINVLMMDYRGYGM
jgi:hypothetical protein